MQSVAGNTMATMSYLSVISVILAIFMVNQAFGNLVKRQEEEELDDVGRMLEATPSLEVPQKSKLGLGYDSYKIDNPSVKTDSRYTYTFQYKKGGPLTTLRVNPETMHFQRQKKDLE